MDCAEGDELDAGNVPVRADKEADASGDAELTVVVLVGSRIAESSVDDGVGSTDGDAVGDAVGELDAEGFGDVLADGEAEGDEDGEGDADGDGESALLGDGDAPPVRHGGGIFAGITHGSSTSLSTASSVVASSLLGSLVSWSSLASALAALEAPCDAGANEESAPTTGTTPPGAAIVNVNVSTATRSANNRG